MELYEISIVMLYTRTPLENQKLVLGVGKQPLINFLQKRTSGQVTPKGLQASLNFCPFQQLGSY